MEANELMLGDYIYDLYGNKAIVRKLEDYNEHAKASGACIELVEGPEEGKTFCLYGQIEPIPLTPEIMGKNCTLIEREYKFGEYPNILSIMYDSSARIRIMEGDCEYYGIEIKYVHELQHALRLAGIKKEIVL